VSLTEIREEARLLDKELTRQGISSDSSDARAGIALGFAGVLAGLLVQVKHPSAPLQVAAVLALGAAIIALAAAFPRQLRNLDLEVVADLYERLPEADATSITSNARLRAIGRNYSITESKRLLLSAAVVVLVVAVGFSAIGFA
jgi:hypothetical protein